MQIRMRLDPREAFDGFDRMARRGRSLGGAFRKIKPMLRADQKEHAAKASGPDGPWPPRASSTMARTRRGKRRHLGRRRRKSSRRPLGKIVTAVTFSASVRGAFGKSKIPWSDAHQDGARVGRGATLPARPFFYISDKLEAEAGQVLANELVEAYEGGG